MSTERKTYSPCEKLAAAAHIDTQTYCDTYKNSIDDPQGFWKKISNRLDWFQKPTKIKNTSFNNDVSIKWYEDGILNACYNCVDRHLPKKENDVALIWEGDDPNDDLKITYGTLKSEVSKLSNALKNRNVKKGDRVTIYMPMVPEAVYAMLACARIGAIHSVVFGGFSPESLKDRILDCDSHVVITADEGLRGTKKIPLKSNTDEALKSCPDVHSVFVLKHTGGDINWTDDRDLWWHDNVSTQSDDCPCEKMNAEDPLFILYTSGSTGL